MRSVVSSRKNRFAQSVHNRAVHCLTFFTFSFFLFPSPPVRADDLAKQSVIIVVGATGAPEYAKEFTRLGRTVEDSGREGRWGVCFDWYRQERCETASV